MIKFKCEFCGKKIGVPDEHAGKRAKCPGCASPIRVPEPVMADVGADALSALEDGTGGALRSFEPAVPSPASSVSDDVQAGTGSKTCPKCGAVANPSAKICVDCGYGFEGMSAKNRARTQKTAGAAGRGLLAVGGGLVIAIACGVIWASIAKATNREFGYLAILLGLGVGFGVAQVCRAQNGWVGLGAVFVSFLGWLTAKMLIASWVIMPMIAEWDSPEMHREVFVVEALYEEGKINDQLYEDWSWDEQTDAQQAQIDRMVEAWVAENGEPDVTTLGEMDFSAEFREGLIVEALLEEGTIGQSTYDNWAYGELTDDQAAELDTQVADWVAQNGEPDMSEYEATAETVDAFVGGVFAVISFIGALSLMDLIWVPLMGFSAYKIGSGAGMEG